jgi:uncharacterized RDD family membrane protein YckC
MPDSTDLEMTSGKNTGPVLASVWARFAALALDGLLWSPVALGSAYLCTRSPALGALIFPAALIAYVAYQILFHATYGATVGKMILRIRVVRIDGSPVDFNAALRRSFVDAVFRLALAVVAAQFLGAHGALPFKDMMEFLTALGKLKTYATLSNFESIWTLSEIATCAFHPQRRALHDLIGGTLVVKRTK